MATKRFWSEVTGEGEPLLLIHGMGSASTAWKLITPKLAKKFQIITVDLPGHGNTPLLESQPMDPVSLGSTLVGMMDAYGGGISVFILDFIRIILVLCCFASSLGLLNHLA